MFSNIFNTIWSNPANRIIEKQIHGETIVLAENEGRLCAAKRVGNEFVSLILSGIATKVNTALDKALTCAQLKDSNLQLVGPQLTVLPRLKGGDYLPFPVELLTDLEGLKTWFQNNPKTTTLKFSHLLNNEELVVLAAALPYSQISHLHLYSDPKKYESVKALADALPHSRITNLDLSYCQIKCEGVKVIAKALPYSRITWLNLTCNQIDLEGTRALCEALPSSKVISLVLEDNDIGIEGVEAIAAVLPHSQISQLRLGGCKAGLKAIAAVLPHSLLTDLAFHIGDNTSSDGVRMLAAVLPFSWMTKLYLNYCAVKDEGAIALAKVLPLSRVSWLSLNNGGIHDEGGKAIVAALSSSSLSGLDLGNNYHITEEVMEMLAVALLNSLLSHLYLNDNRLKPKTIQALVRALSQSQLIEFNLIGNAISTDSAKALAAALPHSPVVNLQLQNTGLLAEGLKAIATVLPNTRIAKLNLDVNPVKDEGIIALAQTLPKSKIHQLGLCNIDFGESGLRALKKAARDSQVSSVILSSDKRRYPQTKEIESHAKTIEAQHQEFLQVCRTGTVEEVEHLLDQGSPIHATCDQTENTALHLAVERNHSELVMLLLKFHAALLCNYDGDTPLDLARKLGHYELIELLEAGLPAPIPIPEPVAVPKDFYCFITHKIMYDPVLLAGDGVTYEREAIEKWLETHDTSPLHGTDLASKLLIPNQFCKGQVQGFIEKYPHLEIETYIPEASKKACLDALTEGDVSGLKTLLEKDQRLLSLTFLHDEPLLELACQSTPEILQTIIEAYQKRPDFNHALCAKAAQGLGAEGVRLLFHLLPKKVPTGLLPALFEAIKLQSSAYLEALLEMGVSSNSRDLRGSYPLHRAVEAGSKELITILMKHDANLKAVDREGRTPLQLAEQLGRLDLVRHIKQKKIEIQIRPLLSPLQEQINAQGRVIQQLRGALFETQTSLGNIVPLLGANPSLSLVADELTALRKRIDQTFI